MPAALALFVLLAAPEVGYKRGNVHPDFHFRKTDGTLGRLSDFRGKNVVLLNFASW